MHTKELINDSSEKAERAQHHAKKAFETTSAAGQEVANSAFSTAKGAYRSSKDALSAAAHDVKDVACSAYSSFADQTANITNEWHSRASELEAELTERVRQKPLHSLGIAFGIGLVLGIILNRK
jgi:ElaB/YqjD/DUF883 family membrane-anchored ribosome-binding protein